MGCCKITTKTMFDFEKYQEIKKNIKKLGKKTNIIAVSKNQTYKDIETAIAHKVMLFGENRVQEAKSKFENILKTNKLIKLHLTGPLQTNKVKTALKLFDVFHTLDRESLLKELSKYQDIIKLKSFFVQINTGKENTKSGVDPENIKSFLDRCTHYGIDNIVGLMCIPPLNDNPKKHFYLLSEMAKKHNLSELSIGMSGDYLDALEFNPTYIRIGTMLFGKRK